MKRSVFVLAILLVAGNARAQELEFERLRAEGRTALYNLDYERARQHFAEMARRFSDHPAGPYQLAATLWLQKLNEARRLQSSLYNSESFYAQNEDRVDERTVQEFRLLTDRAEKLAKARLKKDPRDADALYYLGATAALRAAFAGSVERRFIPALREGNTAVDRHRELLKLDPSYRDAELTVGLYDYVVGSLPLPVKLLASIVGHRGSKRRGIETLERVAREGRWAQDDARVILIAIYKREGRIEDALNAARELTARYPRNYLFKLELADALALRAVDFKRAGETEKATAAEREAIANFDALLRERPARAPDLVRFRFGEALMALGQPMRAAQEFLAAATASGAEASLATMARLRAAQALDLAGRRAEAMVQYRAVLARPNVYDAHELAQRGLREPFSERAEERR
ncbi:MAG: hypothetical protein C4334_02880 [Pyrinomonas sp.]|uniref:hypothetical protein n=1 Tax=Pyrinomonas sp. TaxID=2080306 RepID=UPI003320E54B